MRIPTRATVAALLVALLSNGCRGGDEPTTPLVGAGEYKQVVVQVGPFSVSVTPSNAEVRQYWDVEFVFRTGASYTCGMYVTEGRFPMSAIAGVQGNQAVRRKMYARAGQIQRYTIDCRTRSGNVLYAYGTVTVW